MMILTKGMLLAKIQHHTIMNMLKSITLEIVPMLTLLWRMNMLIVLTAPWWVNAPGMMFALLSNTCIPHQQQLHSMMQFDNPGLFLLHIWSFFIHFFMIFCEWTSFLCAISTVSKIERWGIMCSGLKLECDIHSFYSNYPQNSFKWMVTTIQINPCIDVCFMSPNSPFPPFPLKTSCFWWMTLNSLVTMWSIPIIHTQTVPPRLPHESLTIFFPAAPILFPVIHPSSFILSLSLSSFTTQI